MSDTALDKIINVGTAAARAAFTPSPGTTRQLFIWVDNDSFPSSDPATWVWDSGSSAWIQINTAGAGSVTTTGSPATGQLAIFTGASTITGISGAITPQGRLTLTTGVPYLSSTVTAAGTIYYTPAVGNMIPIYDGTNWKFNTFTELSQALTDATKSPAAAANNSNYDLFIWNDAGTIRCTRGPLWISDTSRGTGAGTTELEFVNGILMNKNAITNGPGADRGVYVGSIRTNGTATVDMIFGGAGAAGGESTILGIWNNYNRRSVSLVNFDNTDSWAYTTATIRIKNNNTANKISFVIGYQGDTLDVSLTQISQNSSANIARVSGIGLNSTTVFVVGSSTADISGVAAAFAQTASAFYRAMAPLGFNYVAPLEWSTASGATSWIGDGGGVLQYSSFAMTTMF